MAKGADEVLLAFLNEGIYAIGPRLKSKEDARAYLGALLAELSDDLPGRARLAFVKGDAGRGTLILESPTGMRYLARMDELTLHRLERTLGRRFVILTGFVENPDGGLDCLALTDGLGAVLYAT